MNKRVYEVKCDVNHFQSLLLENDKPSETYPIEIGTPRGNRIVERRPFQFFNRPMPDQWKCPALYSPNPRLPAPNFWSVAHNVLAADSEVFDRVQTHFEQSGQVLTATVGNMQINLLNVLSVVNCLDHPKCKWSDDDDGRFEDLEQYFDRNIVFLPDRFDESPIFRIPEDPLMILCLEEYGDPEVEFKAAVEEYELTGLLFEILWEA